jgi:SAM-dependent methyltransferase
MQLHSAIQGFQAAPERYEQARPDYPVDGVDWLVERLGSPASVLDVGAGTGKLTRMLLARGLRVVAVEPLDGMRAVLERESPGVDARAGQAEALPLADGEVEAIVAGQAFHWFANERALAEFARVLTARGRLGLIWNARQRSDPLHRAIAEIVAPYRAGVPTHASDDWRAVFDEQAPLVAADEAEFEHRDRLSADGLAQRVLSTSVMSALAADEQERVAARVRALAPAGDVEMVYRTQVFIFERRD